MLNKSCIRGLNRVGPDHIPTFPSGPEPTNCETQTASLCYATTSYVVSTLDSGAVETVSSVVPPASCTEIRGCVVRDSDEESTVTQTAECPTETATDIVITCSGTGTTACSSKTEVERTGCSLTATTTTVTCTPAPSGNTRRQDPDDADNFCPVTQRYVIYPRDGRNLEEGRVALAQMRATLGGDDRIEDYESRRFSYDFWRATMAEDEAQAIREIPNVSRDPAHKQDCLVGAVTDKAMAVTDRWRAPRVHRMLRPDRYIGFPGRVQEDFDRLLTRGA